MSPTPPPSSAHQLHLITSRIRQSLDLEAILETTVAEVRDVLGTDRIKIYQFQADGHGVVRAEARNPAPQQADPQGVTVTYRLPSLLGLHFPADDIPLFARELYLRQRQRTIVNTKTQEIGISPLISPETGHAIDSTQVNYRLVDPCHLEYLRAMGVQASLVLPIVVEMASNVQLPGDGASAASQSRDRDLSESHGPHHSPHPRAEASPDSFPALAPGSEPKTRPALAPGHLPADGDFPNPHTPRPFSLEPNQVLWGLLVAHHSEPYDFTPTDLELLQGIVDQVAIAVAQSVLLGQMCIQNHHESTLNHITRLLYHTPQIELQAALKATVDIFKGCGGRLYLLDNSQVHLPEQNADQIQSSVFHEGPKIYLYGTQPDGLDEKQDRLLEDSLIFQSYLQSLALQTPRSGSNPMGDAALSLRSPRADFPLIKTQSGQLFPALSIQQLRATYNLAAVPSSTSPSGVWAVGDLYQEPLLRPVSMAFQSTRIRSLLMIPLVLGTELLGCLTLFRDEVDQELLWAGAQDPDKRQMAPRQSFEIWRQIKKGQAQAWEQSDLHLAQRLGECFATAVKQYHLYRRVQILNQSLVRQVEIRTTELEHSNRMVQQQQALARILAKLQKAATMASIFRSATDEVRQLLGVDRVSIYRFDEDWGGGFIRDYDSVSPGWANLVLATRSDWNDTYLQEHQGGRYKSHEISAVADIYKAGLSACHLEVLESFYIRAFLVVPIFVNRKLWGLLGIYNHDTPRLWQESEIVFTTQVAAHLGTALQQNAQLVETQREAERVPVMLEQQQTLAGVISKIRGSLDLDRIFMTTTEEVRHLLQADRVGVFQFKAGSNWTEGKFVAENVGYGYRSALDAEVYDRCFGSNHAHRYQEGAIQAVSDIYDSNLSECHRVILEKFQVRANLVIPLTLGQDLWGLLCIHQCSRPREWQNWEIEFVQQIASQLGVALHQAELLRESQETQALANAANRAKSEFLANMSHELRTPLNAILGLSEGLREGVYGELPPRQVQVLGTIEKSGQHLLALINDILDVAKIEAGKIELELVPVDLAKLCETSLNLIRQASSSKQIKLKLSLPDTYPYIILGELRVRQILLNLLSNAVKFTPQGGEIRLVVRLDDALQQVHFQVQDTGIGIEAKYLSELFQPFMQIDSSLNRQYSGTGLGLALAKRLVEMHNGSVTVQSALGEGSCFTVVLPYQLPASGSASVLHLTQTSGTPRLTLPQTEAEPAVSNPHVTFPSDAASGHTAPGSTAPSHAASGHADPDPTSAASGEAPIAQPTPNLHTGKKPVVVASVMKQWLQQARDRRAQALAAAENHPPAQFSSPPDFTASPLLAPAELTTLQQLHTLSAPPPRETPTPTTPSPGDGDGSKPLVLLVEDNLANVDTFSSYLTYRGYDLIVATDGHEAVRLAKEQKPQAILMDIQMPGMDGLEAIVAIRQLPDLAKVPIIALTALAMAGDRERCLAAGATEYLAKPVRMQHLHHALQALLNRRV